MLQKRLKIFNQIAFDNRVLRSPKSVRAVIDGNHTTLQGPLNTLKLEKDVLFGKIKYNDPSNVIKMKDPDQIEEEESKSEWKLVMLNEEIMGDCEVQMAKFDDQEAQMAFRHSSAHILGYAIEQVYQDALLTIGPPFKDGFFYDFDGPIVRGEEDYKKLEKVIKTIVNKNYPFERLLLSKEQALDLFSYNKFKVELITKKVEDNELTSVFKIGDFIDLCTGPHIPSTKYVQAFKIMKNSQAYWLGDSQRDSLQRIYGISFPQKDQLAEYLKLKEEALRRDHRVVGPNQDLFFFSELAPGSPFFLPHGTKIYNKLMEFMRSEYRKRGYQEVISPNMCNIDLWKTSGHYRNYKENLYLVKNQNGDKIESQGLKPMNCPGHCLIFKNQTHSYKELPIRLADFGVLHRNELSGALSGLTRVRRFSQDDAHIFCRRDQIEQEVGDCLSFLEKVYGIFNFDYELFLSTRPDESLGSDELWQEAESQLKVALDQSGKPWKINKGDGAFYGPKIDIVIHDVLGRPQQCGTIQLDFQLPIRFNLQYTTSEQTQSQEGEMHSELFEPDEYSSAPFEWKQKPLKPKSERPVMVHRAIFGSMERFMAILIEHLGGRWPLWLSPRQVKICPVLSKHNDYVNTLEQFLLDKGWEVETDLSDVSLNKKVRNAQIKQFNYILVVGDDEMDAQLVDVRSREGERIGKIKLEEFEKLMIQQYPDDVPLPQKLFK